MARIFARTVFARIAGTAACAAALSLAASPAMARPWHGRYHHDGISGGGLLAGALIIGGIAAVASAANKNSDESEGNYRVSDPAPYQGSSNYSGSGYTGGGIDNAVNMCVGEVERGQDRVSAVDNAARTTDGWRISGQLSAGSGFSCWIDNDGRIRNVDLGGRTAAAARVEAPAEAAPEDQPYDGTGPDNRPVWHGADAGQPSAAPGQWDDQTYAHAREQAESAQN